MPDLKSIRRLATKEMIFTGGPLLIYVTVVSSVGSLVTIGAITKFISVKEGISK